MERKTISSQRWTLPGITAAARRALSARRQRKSFERAPSLWRQRRSAGARDAQVTWSVSLEGHVETKKYKSFRFKNSLAWSGGRRGRASAPGKPEMDVGSPPEFKGEPGLWSPEELLVGALNGCLMLTFVAMAQAKGLQFVAYESAAEGLLENADGKYRITEVSVQPSLVVKSQADLETARAIMDAVEENCFISNSITAQVKLAPQFHVDSDT
jgi:organic hydroperoxide reductase OsmC/OhrA